MYNATSALHVVSDQEDRTAQFSSSPRDVADICDFVFGGDGDDGDSKLILFKLPNLTGTGEGKRMMEDDDRFNTVTSKRLCRRASVRNLSSQSLSLSSSANKQPLEKDEADDWTYLNSMQPISVDGLVSAGSETTLEAPSSVAADSTVVTGNATNDGESSESYGWFVRTDRDEKDTDVVEGADVNHPYSSTSKTSDLAFCASVAPIRTTRSDEQELAYCTAADTVDDVLADFF